MALEVSLYVTQAIMIFGPIFWLYKKYGLNISSLGLQKGRFVTAIGVLIGLVSALIIVISPLGGGLQAARRVLLYRHSQYFFILLTAEGFRSLVLAPISEEIVFRGFIYGCLRKKIGTMLGITTQAMAFSLCHFDIFFDGTSNIGLFISRFALGLILGILYEKTGNLLPSIVCHSLLNYFAMVRVAALPV